MKKDKDLDVTLMTAYFNLYDVYADLILTKCHFPVNIIFGSPKVYWIGIITTVIFWYKY